MKLADITIIEADQVEHKVCQNPSKVTRSFLSALLNDPEFEREFNEVVKELGIKKAYPIDQFDRISNDIYGYYDFFKDSFDGLMLRYSLPSHYRFRLFLLVVFHTFVDIPENEEPDIVYLPDPGEISHYIEGMEENLEQVSAIVLSSQTTKRELIDWIHANWHEIEPEMKKVLPIRPKKGKVYKNVSVAQEAFELRKEGKSYKDISDQLSEKYPGNQNVCDEAWIKNAVIRHQMKSKQFSDKFPPRLD